MAKETLKYEEAMTRTRHCSIIAHAMTKKWTSSCAKGLMWNVLCKSVITWTIRKQKNVRWTASSKEPMN